MSIHPTAQVHSTAILTGEVSLGEGVVIGPYVILEGPIQIGNGTRVAPHSHLIGPLKIGVQNKIGTGCVIGSEPQHLAYRGEPTGVEIGDRNEFREQVTIHRGSQVPGWGTTRIGNDNYLMVNAHVGHDSQLGNNIVMANGVLLGGHVIVQDRALISGNTAVHQHARIGRLAMATGLVAVVQDILPFMTQESREEVAGVNIVGLRRAGYLPADISLLRTAYKLIYRSGDTLKASFEKLQSTYPDSPLITELISFYRGSKRGISRPVRLRQRENGLSQE